MKFKHSALSAVVALVTVGAVSTALADHSWGDYHWARESNPFTLTIINSTTSAWDSYVNTAIGPFTGDDWADSSVLNMVQTNGDESSKTRRSCKGGSGTIRICNLAYGKNGWLGIAGISIDANGHITTGYTKLNDSYFSSGYYATAVWKQSVTCQELGHNLGLDHQDENFSSNDMNSCMDYQDPPYKWPNAHDYQQLETIYNSHTDAVNSYATAGASSPSTCSAPADKGCNAAGANNDVGWGASLGRRGNAETFIRIDPDGTMHLTHVTWAIGY
jgi:hypothetical protein